jgi:hypothetical protein
MTDPPHIGNFSVRCYQLLIYVYPSSFRKKYGWEMTQVFREVVADSVRNNGNKGLVMTWLRVLIDIIGSAFYEHLFELQGKLNMKTIAGRSTKLIAILSVACFWILPFSPILAIAAVSTTKGSSGWPRNLAITGAALCVTWTVAGSVLFFSLYSQDLWRILNG